MSINLLYHDVTSPAADDSSGFTGPEAARYKLTPQEFSRHLDQLVSVVRNPPRSTTDGWSDCEADWTITFDDGGTSSATIIAPALERRGWRGWFFIATDFIGKPGFCTREQLCELRARGHVIGSHSCSHPAQISACSPDQLRTEWTQSCAVLQDILQEPVRSASVPGGFYSTDVARAAFRAGIRWLFTSEPTTHEFRVNDCRVIGRYNIYRGMPAQDASALITSPIRRWRQATFWNIKKAAKRCAGPLYRQLRRRILSQAYR